MQMGMTGSDGEGEKVDKGFKGFNGFNGSRCFKGLDNGHIILAPQVNGRPWTFAIDHSPLTIHY
jgi:hypothetical protein